MKQKTFIPKFSTEFSEYFEELGKPNWISVKYYKWLLTKYCIVSGYCSEERHHVRTAWNCWARKRPDHIWAVPTTQKVHAGMWHKLFDYMGENRDGTEITGKIDEWVVEQIKLLHAEFMDIIRR